MSGQLNETGIYFTHYVQSNENTNDEIIDIDSAEELDSAKVFFSDDIDIVDSEIDFSPDYDDTEYSTGKNVDSNDEQQLAFDRNVKDRITDDEFTRRKEALSSVLDECMRPLLEKIEEQAQRLVEKDLEIKKISMQLKLLPDLEKQLSSSDEEMKLKHFENHTLKKQLALVESNQKGSKNMTRLSNSIIQKVENKAQKMQFQLESANDELESANREIERLKKSNQALEESLDNKNTPWWQMFFN